MPAMPRPSGKARKIAYAILGKPDNMKRKSDQQTKTKEKLVKEDISQVK